MQTFIQLNSLYPGTKEQDPERTYEALANHRSDSNRVNVLNALNRLLQNYQGKDLDLIVNMQLRVRDTEDTDTNPQE